MRRALSVLLLVGVACGPSAPGVVGPRPGRTARVPTLTDLQRLAVAPSPPAFDRNDLVGAVQGGSAKLARVVRSSDRLQVSALHSPVGSAAVEVLEQDRSGDVWGRFLIPAERRIIAAFAARPSLGSWLIIVDDVRVRGGADAVPITGYRWRRADVKAYASCGIPPRAIDACTSAFYAKPEMWLLPTSSKTIGA